jgi:hypothetical protein
MDANLGRLVTEGPDVCDYKSRIRQRWPECSTYYDTWDKEWVVTATDKRGTEYFVLADKDLANAWHRLEKADNAAPGSLDAFQLNEFLEKEQERLQDEDMQAFRDIAGDAAERLSHALKKDGIHDHENIYGPKPKRHLAQRDVRIRS